MPGWSVWSVRHFGPKFVSNQDRHQPINSQGAGKSRSNNTQYGLDLSLRQKPNGKPMLGTILIAG